MWVMEPIAGLVRQLLPATAQVPAAAWRWVLLLLTLPVVVWSGRHFYVRAWGALRHRGADMNAMRTNGSTALINAANTRNWKAALLLLQLGADWRRGRSLNGLPFNSMV